MIFRIYSVSRLNGLYVVRVLREDADKDTLLQVAEEWNGKEVEIKFLDLDTYKPVDKETQVMLEDILKRVSMPIKY